MTYKSLQKCKTMSGLSSARLQTPQSVLDRFLELFEDPWKSGQKSDFWRKNFFLRNYHILLTFCLGEDLIWWYPQNFFDGLKNFLKVLRRCSSIRRLQPTSNYVRATPRTKKPQLSPPPAKTARCVRVWHAHLYLWLSGIT